ncbi:MAG: hypothetical protein GX442_14815 [Candidatus Riflebacteria bacterium]|nr:hypothetical protein [Candidatus Riflebacteria bacterium]
MFRPQPSSPQSSLPTLLLALTVGMALLAPMLAAQEVVVDAETLIQANKLLFDGKYLEAAGLYGQVTRVDGALFREAHLGKCLCFAMLAFTAESPDEAIGFFRRLVEAAGEEVPMEGLADGNIHINRRFITDLLTLFGRIGSLGGGDVSQGQILSDDANLPRYAPVIDELGTGAQKAFVQFFGWSMTLSGATGKLAAKDFEGCQAEAAKVAADRPQHIKTESQSLQGHARRMVETRNLVDELKDLLDGIRLDPRDPNFRAVEEAKEKAGRLQELLKN